MKRFTVLVILLAAIPVALAQVAYLPNPKLTPGAFNPAITQANMKDTICNPAWSTKSVRPPSNYTNALKIKQIAQYGYVDKDPTHYEQDHLGPLLLGGEPYDPRNEWPQPRSGAWTAVQKDKLEVRAHKLVCSGKVPLRQMQKEIATNWVAAYKKYVGAK